jgi:aminotransferase
MRYEEKMVQRVTDLPKSGIRKFFDIASTLDDCISLGVGEPDFVTPWEIRDAAIKAMQAGRTQYTSNAGLLSLRKEIAFYLSSRFGVSYEPETEIIATIGASEAIDLSLRTLVENGDEVLIPSPSYVSYEPNVRLVGGVPVPLLTTVDNQFKLTPELIERSITEKTKVIILPYPNNPTGAIMTKEELAAIAPTIIKHDLMVISDEIYAELTYGEVRHASIAAIEGMKERTVLINGFSKAFAMTGWRLGYFCAPKAITEQIYKIHQYTIMCAPTFSQVGGETALKIGRQDGYRMVEEMRASYDIRRRYLLGEFNKMGLNCFEPKGAFYLFPCVKSTGLTGDEFAERLLVEKHVAVVPGSAFGESGKYFVRASYATSLKDLKIAAAKIREFISELK